MLRGAGPPTSLPPVRRSYEVKRPRRLKIAFDQQGIIREFPQIWAIKGDALHG